MRHRNLKKFEDHPVGISLEMFMKCVIMHKEIPVKVSKEKISEFCKKWKVKEFALFGSVLRGDFKPDSDIDVLVDFEQDSGRTLFDLVDMIDELKIIFGRNVDLLTRKAVERSRNYIRRKETLSSAEVVYVS